jgi:ubiquinone/menaquinone biosynthesis C-methylase UbiE
MNATWVKQCTLAYPYQLATVIWRSIELEVLDQTLRAHKLGGWGLDVGCGDGKTVGLVKSSLGSSQLVGVDVDPQETALATQSGMYARVHSGTAAHIPEADNFFDFAISNSVLEHIPLEHLPGVIREVARVLKPGAPFFFTVPSAHFRNLLAGPNRVFQLLGRNRDAYLKDMDRRLAHYHYLTPEQWSSLLERNNLQTVQQTGYFVKEEVRRWETLSNVTTGVFHAAMQKHPLEIQRTLGLRKPSQPGWLAGLAGLGLQIVTRDLQNRKDTADGQFGCLLVVGQKRA